MKKELTQKQYEFWSRIYTTIFWTSLALIFLWYILKSIGVIQTPLWIEMLPVAIAIFGAGAFFKQITTDIKNLKLDVSILKDKTNHLESDMHFVKAQF